MFPSVLNWYSMLHWIFRKVLNIKVVNIKMLNIFYFGVFQKFGMDRDLTGCANFCVKLGSRDDVEGVFTWGVAT